MIKIDYKLKAFSPIHTGSDEDSGTTKTLRRMKIGLKEPKKIKTNLSYKKRLAVISELLFYIWESIDKKDIKGKRLMTIWEEFKNKLVSASMTPTKAEFLNSICSKWNIGNFHEGNVRDVLKILDSMTNEEFFTTIKENYMLLILMTRQLKNTKIEKLQESFLDKKPEDIEVTEYIKYFDELPFISGNSIRGKLRRLIMKDYIDICGIEKIDSEKYHMLFTGGALTEKNSFEDIAKKEELVNICPAIGLLGCATGGSMIQGMIYVGNVYPICEELGLSNISYWNMLDIIFQTRHDDEKTETKIEISRDKKDENPHQMKYEYEVFVVGTNFKHGFRLDTDSELLISCFWRMLKLFKENPYIGGMSSVGNGEIDLSDLEIKVDLDRLYIEHLQKNKEKIQEYFKC